MSQLRPALLQFLMNKNTLTGALEQEAEEHLQAESYMACWKIKSLD